MGAPVAWWASAAAVIVQRACASRAWKPPATLISPARTPDGPMPVVSSATNVSASRPRSSASVPAS